MTYQTIQTRYLLAFLRGVEETCRRHNDVGGLQVVENVREWVATEQPVAPSGGPCCEHNPLPLQRRHRIAESDVVPAIESIVF